ncbi:Adenylate chloroplastic [Micractinium conductrix]|uniref:adenylate kinase n=1 Tax=Micractinium conductrix TaxID=554055 RepID=A0A2P6VJW9_9CHLO|nr:Adenylate chloroplastic [Micractinium conductrix]|eukprot:PSC74401.1 Adenylate chloroplastic [Micractinium conductrix]
MVQPVWLEEERPVEPPKGLQELLLKFATAATKEQPADLEEFGARYFGGLMERRRAAEARKRAPPLRVVISGAPASGKGTQAARIVSGLGLVHISAGDLLRAEVAAGSELGQQAQAHMEAGGLVPDELVAALVGARLAEADCVQHGWLLDGYPRTAAQCTALKEAGIHPDLLLSIEVPDAVLVARVAGRRLDPDTGHIYHLTFKPPPPEVADRLVQRSDDNEYTIRARIQTYKAHVSAVKEALGAARLAEVDGDRPEGAVWADVSAALAAAQLGAARAADAVAAAGASR